MHEPCPGSSWCGVAHLQVFNFISQAMQQGAPAMTLPRDALQVWARRGVGTARCGRGAVKARRCVGRTRQRVCARRGVVWCGVVWCGVVWCGVVWCGVVWCGVVWCGVVWCGVTRQRVCCPRLARIEF
eukprot:355663-Chlamydomonas_euryale.AAC.1